MIDRSEAPLRSDTEAPSLLQQVAESTHGTITPANVIDATALVGAKYGMDNFDTARGKACVIASYAADIIDGPIARRTGTQSDLGEMVDATGDKLKAAYAIFKLWQNNLADKPLLAAVGAQNTANTILTLVDRTANNEPSIHPSRVGKRSFFMQELGIGINVAGNQLASRGLRSGEKIRKIGNVVGGAGVALGTVATAGYYIKLKDSFKSK